MGLSLCDTHIHTKYSCDSGVALEQYCLAAIYKGIDAICFTDHIDLNINDDGCGYYDAEKFFDDYLYVKSKYKTRIRLLCGIEFAEPHLYQDKFFEYSILPYDYIIGSIHWWYESMFPSVMVKENIPVEVCYEHYWNEVLAAVKGGMFDCLGHIDFPKRFYGKLLYDPEKLNEILIVMIRNGIALEINTSTLRKNIEGTMPDKEILAIYKDCGGRYVTLGSDAHKAEDLAAGFDYAKELVEYFGLTEVVYIQREGFVVS